MTDIVEDGKFVELTYKVTDAKTDLVHCLSEWPREVLCELAVFSVIRVRDEITPKDLGDPFDFFIGFEDNTHAFGLSILVVTAAKGRDGFPCGL